MKRKEVLMVYCTPEEKELIRKHADQDRRGMTSFVLQIVMDHINQKEDE